MQPKKLFVLIPTLSGGGSEKVTVQLLQYLDKSKYSPYLVLFEKKGKYLKDIPSSIPILELKKKRSRKTFPWLMIYRLAKLIKKERPDIIISFLWYQNFICLLAAIFSWYKEKVVVSERITLSYSAGWFIDILRKITIRFFYPMADEIIVNSQKMAHELEVIFNVPINKIKVIYNPIDIKKIKKFCQEDVNNPWYEEDIPIIIAIGRLTTQKGFSYLIRAVSLLTKNGIDCKLVILGEGVESKKLQSLSNELGIEDRVHLLGFKSNPYKYLARSTVFVLSSLYEGFPNVLLEALALGVPAIATDCPTGPREIITHDVNGILVRPADERALADAIQRLLMDKDLRERLSVAARKRAEDFGVEKIIRQYEDVIDNI